MNQVRVLGALFVRDLRMAVSYRVGFILSAAGAIVNVIGVFFLSQVVTGAPSSALGAYGDQYFGFVLVGVALTNFMALGLGGLAGRIREGLTMGTLEFMLVSPNPLVVLLLGSAIWSHVFGALTVVLYFVVGIPLGLDLSDANVPVALVTLVLAVVSFNGLGLIAASVVILIKQGDPVTWVVSTASVLLSGVFYPVAVLPAWLQGVAQLLPLTHALDVMRRALFAGESLATLWPSRLAVAVLAVGLLAVGIVACTAAVRTARRDGSLSAY
jgi:ABC-2 type transport system permease protein